MKDQSSFKTEEIKIAEKYRGRTRQVLECKILNKKNAFYFTQNV
jgi:hypothetical protein